MHNLRKQSYEIQKAITASTGAGAPESVELIIAGSYITGVYFYSDDSNTQGNVYFRLSGDQVIFPGFSDPLNANVPNGWAAGLQRVYHDVCIPVAGPTYKVNIEFINQHTSAINVTVVLVVSQSTSESILAEIAERLDEINHNLSLLIGG